MSNEVVSDILLVVTVVALLAVADRVGKRFAHMRVLFYVMAIVFSAAAAVFLRLAVRRVAG